MYFKTGITMHLVRTFKTVELFKDPLCEVIYSEWTEIKEMVKMQDIRTWSLAHTMKAVSLSLV